MAPKARKQAVVAKTDALMDQVVAKPSAKKVLTRKTTDAVVDKIIVDNFKDKTQMEVDGLIVEGMTLRNRLLKDRRHHNLAPRSLPMGGPYYKKLKTLYCSDESPFRSLRVLDDSLAIDESLIESLLALKGPTKHRGLLADWLSSTPHCNQSELVGVLKVALEHNPLGSSNSLYIVVDTMTFIKRLSLDKMYGAEVSCLRSHFDTALVRLFSQMFQDGVTAKTFIKLYGDITSLVINEGDVKQILATKADWLPMSDTLDRVIQGSSIGMKMFGFTIPLLRAAAVKKVMVDELHKLDGMELTVDRIAAARTEVTKLLKGVPGLATLPALRKITVFYRDVEIVVPVQSVTEDLQIRIAAIVKTKARDQDLLPALFMEDVLVARNRVIEGGQVSAELLAESKVARATANQMLGSENWLHGEAVQSLLDKKGTTLVALDRTFAIERCFILAMLGAAGEKRLLQELLAILPSSVRDISLKDCASKVATLTGTDLFRFCSRSAQGGVKATHSLLQNMVLGFPPSFGAAESSRMLLIVRQQFPYFVRQNTSVDLAAPTFIFGPAALMAKLEVVKDLVAKASPIDLCQLELFHVFGYMLKAAESEFVKTTTQAVVGKAINAGVASASGVASNSSNCSSGAAAAPIPKDVGCSSSKMSSSATDRKSAVLSLFKN